MTIQLRIIIVHGLKTVNSPPFDECLPIEVNCPLPVLLLHRVLNSTVPESTKQFLAGNTVVGMSY